MRYDTIHWFHRSCSSAREISRSLREPVSNEPEWSLVPWLNSAITWLRKYDRSSHLCTQLISGCEKQTFKLKRDDLCDTGALPTELWSQLGAVTLNTFYGVYYEVTKWPAPRWLDSSVGRALHRYRRGHGFESCWSPGVRFSKAPETFRARKAISNLSVSKNREVYTPETSCMKRNSVHIETWIKQLCNYTVRDFAMAFRAWKHFGTFEKRAQDTFNAHTIHVRLTVVTYFMVSFSVVERKISHS